MQDRRLFLLCNDDGVQAPGIRALAEEVRKLGDVVIVAPHVERSASSQAISTWSPLRIEKVDENVYGVEGFPADCVIVALRKILHRRPSWVLSGVNRGGNLGVDTLYSGTVGAALEGRLNGIPAMAVSAVGHGKEPRYDTAARVARWVLENESRLDLDTRGVLNVNVPPRSFEELRGVTGAVLGRPIYEPGLVENVDPRGRAYYWLGGSGSSYEDIPGSDCALVDEGYATISVLTPSLFAEGLTSSLSTKLTQLSLHG